MTRPVVLVDGTNVLIRSFFASPDLRSPSGLPTGAAFGVASRVREAVERFRPRRVVAFWDGGRSAWRRAIYPGYKVRAASAARPDLGDCFAQRPVVRRLLGELGVDQVEVPGVEADDLIAAWVFAHAGPEDDPLVLLSTDRDFYQLVRPALSIYVGTRSAPAARDVTDETFAAVSGKSSPGEWLAYRVVNGDVSDAVPRVRGLSGEKRWAHVYPVLVAMGYAGDAVDFFVGQAELGARPADARSVVARVYAAWGELGRNALLMDLRFAVRMLPTAVRRALPVERGAWDARAAERTCSRLNFQSLVRDWTAFARTIEGLACRR